MPAPVYSSQFFDNIKDGSLSSAEVVVPLVMDMVRPRTIIDVGCGQGAWLSVFARHGAEVTGCDGEYVIRESLLIPRNRFCPIDLSNPQKIKGLGAFDLCMSLEVAEHLPQAAAEAFVATLTGLAPLVFFSAATPGQGGTHHVNEQWPPYWAELFSRHRYQWLDPFRMQIWNNPHVKWWYRQNIFLFVAADRMRRDWERYRASAADLHMINPIVLHDMTRPAGLVKSAFRSVGRTFSRLFGK